MAQLKNYITAKDNIRYRDLPEGIILVNMTHNYLKAKCLELRLDKSMTIEQVKLKIYHFVGTPVNDQALVLKDENGAVVCELANDNMLLGAYPIDSGMEIYCVDTNPFSKAKGGAYEDVNLVQKYVMSDEEYDKRKGTVRDYKREMLKKDPNFKFKTFTVNPDNEPPPGPQSVEQFIIGNRCEVNPGGRRGEIKWKGCWENEEDKGYWVGVQFDEPVGQGTGKHKGKEYFTCEDKYGSFVRGKNVTMGDFPDVLLEDSSEDEL